MSEMCHTERKKIPFLINYQVLLKQSFAVVVVLYFLQFSSKFYLPHFNTDIYIYINDNTLCNRTNVDRKTKRHECKSETWAQRATEV